jgi:hypothetical protein
VEKKKQKDRNSLTQAEKANLSSILCFTEHGFLLDQNKAEQNTRTKLVGLFATLNCTLQWSPGSDRFCPYLKKKKREYDVEPKGEKKQTENHHKQITWLISLHTRQKSQYHCDKAYYYS